MFNNNLDVKHLYISLVFLLFGVNSFSQSYSTAGDAIGITPFDNSCPSDTCFTLTPDLLWKNGAVFSNQLLDLTKPFDGTFCLFLGTKDATGADGFAFVLKDTNTPLIGTAGGGLGYNSLSPSIAIEFDTWYNAGADIPADHTSLAYNGNSVTPVVPSISLLPSGGNVENGMPHNARIVWTPNDTTLYMFFDNNLRFIHRVDLINTIFGGATKVNYGFTSSTGGSSNLQRICFPKKSTLTYFDTICEEECLDFNDEVYSFNYTYSWAHSSSDTLPSLRICPDSSSVFFLYKKSKLTGIIDTFSVYVQVEEIPSLNLGDDIILCEGSVTLDASINNGISYLWNDNITLPLRTVSNTGTYWAEATTEFCKAKDSIEIICIDLPNVFSPNNDGINDYYSPFKLYDFTEATFTIYNRWGSIVYETSQINEIKKGWNGKFNSKDCSAGVYYYTLVYRLNKSEDSNQTKGFFQLFK